MIQGLPWLTADLLNKALARAVVEFVAAFSTTTKLEAWTKCVDKRLDGVTSSLQAPSH